MKNNHVNEYLKLIKFKLGSCLYFYIKNEFKMKFKKYLTQKKIIFKLRIIVNLWV